ncbi:taurine catabolism dioxygenase TauD/TfdA [Chondrocystis sp. NIES-4102]|nr:taurine catabolism dioxygenase TauD/TfdA [Chondrocystis sp. NIES-4102]
MFDIKSIKRKSIVIEGEDLIKTELLNPHKRSPLVIKPNMAGINLINWATNYRDWIDKNLLEYGALLLRDFAIKPTTFEPFIRAIAGELLDYSYRSTPRTLVNGKIYTSTEYPPQQFIPLHNEMSYARYWASKIWFYCVQPAKEGGETPIADSRQIFKLIPTKIREKFIAKQVMYVRNYGQGLDLDWQTVFQTDNKQVVEDYCDQVGIDWQWLNENHLRTRQVCPAITTHPITKEVVWFNQAHLFHVSMLPNNLRESLLSLLPLDDLPRNSFYGDGTVIEDGVIEEINNIYLQEMFTFPWQAGDILMLDNLLFAHGRNPFLGTRKVLVGMA